MTHNGTAAPDLCTIAAEGKAAEVWTRLGYPGQDRGYRVLVAELEELYRRSGAVVEVDDHSVFCRPRVTWPGRPVEPHGGTRVLGTGIVAFWCLALGFAAGWLGCWAW